MGIFDRGSGVPPSGKDLMWFDELSDDGGGADGGGAGCGTGLMVAIGVVIGFFVVISLGWCH